ncbi:MAG TPA: hypothetical protein VIH35_04485, partial [Kiritimatiellia bacterium]
MNQSDFITEAPEVRAPSIIAGLSAVVTVVVSLGFLTGCATVAKVGAGIGQATGAITPQQAESIVKSGEAFGKAMEQITPEQEYYVGRAVGATLISSFKAYDNDRAT